MWQPIDTMTERDRVITELIEIYARGFVFVRRPDHTIEIYEGAPKVVGKKLEYIGYSAEDNDEDGALRAWLMSQMDNPPPHIKKLVRESKNSNQERPDR